MRYKKTPLDYYKRTITHYGFSFGFFSGLGATALNEYVTQHAINMEYDGFVNPSGVAFIIAVDKLSFGITGGIDHLLDRNRHYWLYQGKPWIGISAGLNLN